jgi:hypothetical protein
VVVVAVHGIVGACGLIARVTLINQLATFFRMINLNPKISEENKEGNSPGGKKTRLLLP